MTDVDKNEQLFELIEQRKLELEEELQTALNRKENAEADEKRIRAELAELPVRPTKTRKPRKVKRAKRAITDPTPTYGDCPAVMEDP